MRAVNPFGIRRPRPATRAWLLLVPGGFFLFAFFLWPVAEVAVRSLTDPPGGLQNYQSIASSVIAPHSFLITLQVSVVVTAICVVLGYPLAYMITIAPPRVGRLLIALTLISLFISQVARTFAWEVILDDTGIINNALIGLGLIKTPLPLIRDALGVGIGMTNVLLPTMVLPIYVVMQRIDPEVGRAAAGLGASPRRSFLRVFLPLSFPGIISGCLLVFMLALGFYVTPSILGGGTFVMVGELVVNQFQNLDWGVGSALSVVLLIIVAIVLIVSAKLVGLESMFGIARERDNE
jgi:putative spermidine/putrescine transport system permease protein